MHLLRMAHRKFSKQVHFNTGKAFLFYTNIYIINKMKWCNYSLENAYHLLITIKSMKLFWQAYIASSIWQKYLYKLLMF